MMSFLLGSILGAQIIILIKLSRMECRIVERGDLNSQILLKHFASFYDRLSEKLPYSEKKGKKSKP